MEEGLRPHLGTATFKLGEGASSPDKQTIFPMFSGLAMSCCCQQAAGAPKSRQVSSCLPADEQGQLRLILVRSLVQALFLGLSVVAGWAAWVGSCGEAGRKVRAAQVRG